MVTLVFSAAGAALGAGFGGTVLGLSGAVIGRAVGASLGRAIDQRILGGGAEPVQSGRIDRLRLTNAGEGGAIPRLWGRMRLGAQLIWSTGFEEHANRRRGGKASGPKVSEYGYTISLALGLCEGPILGIGRIWADGTEITPAQLGLRLYPGSSSQLPDPKIEAVEGSGQAPAYRGLAYVVLEDLDLAPYGNRVPQFSFEVLRQAATEVPTLASAIRAVAMIPGTGEYALATTPVHENRGPGENRAINTNSHSGQTDFATSLQQLRQELPNCHSVSLVVSWFGSDLRCGTCRIRPLAEQAQREGEGMLWQVGGLRRHEVGLVPQIDGRPVYGGTPCDASVIEAITALKAAGQQVMYYPFVLMDQQAGNGRPDPWSDTPDQPVMPWRGRITTAKAPGRPGSSDRSASAETEVAAFFGQASAADFTVTGGSLSYHGAEDWGFRRFILHQAFLCQAAGGVDAFCIGSEMVGLTRIRGAGDSFPAVTALRQLAADLRHILGPACKLSYAADWTEYGSYFIDGNLYFPLDPLWADAAIDFIGIDNYMPVSDWRDGLAHADAEWQALHNIDYLKENIAGGEGFDWYYDSPEGAAAQIRLPIEDGAYDEPWVFRVKDLKSWWSLPHHPRIGALRAAQPTAWLPVAKPIRFTEYGCAAIDRGGNQPNRFLDLHSSESQLPRGSDAGRDDLMQMQYYRAMADFWADPGHNPTASLYDGRMVQTEYSHAWAWDARPFPAFPARLDLWADGNVYRAGHWLNGRATHQPLAAVIREIAGALPAAAVHTGRCHGLVRGYALTNVQSARASLQPLLMGYGLDAVERDGQLQFISRLPGIDHVISPDRLAVTEALQGMAEFSRQSAAEPAAVLRLTHIEAEGDFNPQQAEARLPDLAQTAVALAELPLVLTPGEGRAIAARWLAEARIGVDALRLALPPSQALVGAGDRLSLPDGSQFRIEQLEDTGPRDIQALRIEGGLYHSSTVEPPPAMLRPFVAPVPVFPLFLDLPLLTGAEVPHQPHLAVAAKPWAGPVALWSALQGGEFTLNRLVTAPAILGVTESDLPTARPGLWQRGMALRLRLGQGRLESRPLDSVLSGANAMAIGPADGQGSALGNSVDWEVFQFVSAELVGPRRWDISQLLRGQLGTDGIMPAIWPAGSLVVALDASLVQVDLAPNLRGISRRYRIGGLAHGFDHPSVVQREQAFDGIGLRPYPVAHLRHRAMPGGDHFSWIRRSRIDADSWQPAEIPLGESREAYLLRIMLDGRPRREVELAVPQYLYPAAARLADGAGAGFTLAVAQLSDRFGPGPFRQIRLG